MVHATALTLGDRTFDIGHRALVMGILNRTPDSFYDRGATYALDDLLRRAERLVDDGADLLDVGGVKAGPGSRGRARPRSSTGSSPPSRPCRARFDCPLSVDTWRASVAEEAYAVGCGGGQRHQRVRRPRLPPVAAAAGATVVATHIRLGPADPRPRAGLRRRGGDGGGLPGRAGRVGASGRAARRPDHASTPGSTWARRPRSR